MQKFSNYCYKVLCDQRKIGWYYEIYSQDEKELIVASLEFFDSEGSARYAAIGHIDLLESQTTLKTAEAGHS